jgi:Glycosyltransferase family 87
LGPGWHDQRIATDRKDARVLPTPPTVTDPVTAPPPGSAAAAPAAGQPGRPAGGRVLAAGAAALTVAVAAYAANLLSHPRAGILSWLDLRFYLAAGQVARDAPAALYRWQYRPGMRFTYPPFAALVFSWLAVVPWNLLAWAMTVASALALGLTVWLTFGGLGWTGRRRAGAALAVTAAAFWIEPVQRALHWGQVDLLLMALVVWDLCQPGQRRWQGAGIGLAAAVKLVPLIFIPYLLLTRRPRQAAVALATFLALAGVGFLALPAASGHWWFGGLWLHVGRLGFAGSVANQSLLGYLIRDTGSIAAATPWWLAMAGLVGVTGLEAAVRWHRRGWPVHGWLTCALTGLLICPVSWDHHWVWLVPALAVLADGAVGGRVRATWARWACGAAAAGLAIVAGAWPAGWPPPAGQPWGLIWTAPFTPGVTGPHPEYHWHGAVLVAGNLYLLAGLALLAGLTVLAFRSPPAVRSGR